MSIDWDSYGNGTDAEIRPVTILDAGALASIYAPYVEKTAITFEYEPPSEEEFRERIRHTLSRYPYILAHKGEEILGYAYAGPFKGRAAYDWAVETSIYIKMGSTKQGIGSLLYEAMEDILKRMNVINLYACIACTDIEDPYLTNNSVDYHRHMGYHMIGQFHQCGYKFGRWYHMVWMGKMLGEHRGDPEPILWFPDLLIS